MSTKKIIVDIPFNICFANHYPTDSYVQGVFNRHFPISQTKAWIDYRIGIFMKFTGKGFMNQTNQNFTCLLRYHESSRPLIFAALANHPALPENIKFVTTPEADAIIDKAIEEHDYLYHVNIDSDNIYESHFIEQVDNYVYEEGIECLLCHEGYIYDTPTDRLAKINHYSPSLYVYIYNKESYKKYFRERIFEPHANAELRKNVGMPGRTYMLITHETNLDNNFDLIKNWLGDGTVVDNPEKDAILNEWKIK